MTTFTKAVKRTAKLRMALSGPSGSGKTYTALVLAQQLAAGKGPVAVIDTERGSASKYADLFEFDVLELEPPYHPDRYIQAIHDAEAAGYAVLIIDSLTHAWTGAGGLLEVHEQVVQRQTTKNSYTAWAHVTPIQARFIDAITSAKLHVIATMRAKTEYVQGEGRNGKTEIRKVGTAPIQRDGMEFEFDILGEMDQDNTLVVGKTRCPALAGAVISKPGTALAITLGKWLAGADPQPSAPTPPTRPTPIRRAPATPAPVETTAEPPITFTEASLEDSDAVTYDGVPDVAPLTIAGFLAKAKAELDLTPKQAMERLGVRALSGLNLDAAFAKLSDGLKLPPSAQREYDLRELPMAAHGSH